MASVAVDLVAIAAALLCFFTAAQTGMMRSKHKIQAPAVTGHPEFERVYRIQMNTLEQVVPFLIVLYLAERYANDWLAAGLGAIWIAGRIIYIIGYRAAAEKRGTGFIIAFAAFAALSLVSLVMAVRALFILA